MNLDEMNELDWTLNMRGYGYNEYKKLPERVQEMIFVANEVWKGKGNIAYCTTPKLTPIEQMFNVAWEITIDKEIAKEGFEKYIYLDPQNTIETNGHKYIADFVYTPEIQLNDYAKQGKRKLVIECDGHEFHQKNKEQVIKDNQREYDLKMAGYDVLRFSGSEIYNTPYGCAEKTLNYIKKLIKGDTK